MLTNKKKKKHIGAKNSGQKLDFAILEILEFECFPFGPFGSDPGFQDSCSEHISDPKCPIGQGRPSTPPFGSSAVKLVTLDRGLLP
jgi:hypothetical protein